VIIVTKLKLFFYLSLSLSLSPLVNQRCIRHKNDHGAVILLDSRFLMDEAVAQLSRWTYGSIRRGMSLLDVANSLRHFFRDLAIDPPRSHAPLLQSQAAGKASSNATCAAVDLDVSAAASWVAAAGFADRPYPMKSTRTVEKVKEGRAFVQQTHDAERVTTMKLKSDTHAASNALNAEQSLASDNEVKIDRGSDSTDLLVEVSTTTATVPL
jgi:hypothetical protein